MAYRLLREFRQAFTRLDTPPFSIRHHPGSVIAPVNFADLGTGYLDQVHKRRLAKHLVRRLGALGYEVCSVPKP
jgi:hypothetical protein